MKKDQLIGGKADKKSPKDFDQDQLAQGIKVEMEHTKDKAVAQEIAMDHLSEDTDYYKKLKRAHLEKNDTNIEAFKLKKSKESKMLPAEQRKAFRQAVKQFQGKDVLSNQLTASKGVSDRGIEARRADSKIKGTIAHGFARTGRPIEEQKKLAVKYFKQVLNAQRNQPKPILKTESPELGMSEWTALHDKKTGTVKFTHEKHGTIAVSRTAGDKPYVVHHNGRHVGNYKTIQETLTNVKNYAARIKPKMSTGGYALGLSREKAKEPKLIEPPKQKAYSGQDIWPHGPSWEPKNKSERNFPNLKKTDLHAFKKPHFIFSAENPIKQPKLNLSTDEVLNKLKEMGEKAEKVRGQYGSPETSIFIHEPKNIKKLHDLAENLGQESAIVSNGINHEMHYYNGPNSGKIRLGKGTEVFSKKPKDFFTSMPDRFGNETHFSHNFDWEDKNLFNKAEKENIKLTHYSVSPNLSEVDPKFMGSGLGSQGAESKHGKPEVERSYFYIKGTEPEDIIKQKAKNKYTSELLPHQKLYDIGKDLENIKANLENKTKDRQINPGVVTDDEFLKAVKDAGYYGFFNSSSGLPNAVGLFYKHPVRHFVENKEADMLKKSIKRSLKDLKPDVSESINQENDAKAGKPFLTDYSEHRGKKVFVYFNLHKRCWSVKDPKTGVVLFHTNDLHIDNPELKVGEKARQRVMQEKQKNVHAGVQGILAGPRQSAEAPTQISYNPYKAGHFYHAHKDPETTPVHTADHIRMGVVKTKNPQGAEVNLPTVVAFNPMHKGFAVKADGTKVPFDDSEFNTPKSEIQKSYKTDIMCLLEDLQKSKNVREQRAKTFGLSGEPQTTSKEGKKFHEKQSQALARLSEKRYGLKLTPSGGKFRDLGYANKQRMKEGLAPLTEKEIKSHPDYETSKNGKLFRSKKQKSNPKPDWRSGKLEAQRHVGAKVHEMSHLEELQEGLGLPEAQEWMDRGTALAASKYHGAGKQIEREITPMAMENKLRRRAGIPAYGRPQENDPRIGFSSQKMTEDSPERVSLDTGRKYGKRLKDPKTGQIYDLIAQSKNITPEMEQRMEDVDTGQAVFDPEKGWTEGQSIHGRIARKQKIGPKEYFKKLLEANKKKGVA